MADRLIQPHPDSEFPHIPYRVPETPPSTVHEHKPALILLRNIINEIEAQDATGGLDGATGTGADHGQLAMALDTAARVLITQHELIPETFDDEVDDRGGMWFHPALDRLMALTSDGEEYARPPFEMLAEHYGLETTSVSLSDDDSVNGKVCQGLLASGDATPDGLLHVWKPAPADQDGDRPWTMVARFVTGDPAEDEVEEPVAYFVRQKPAGA